MMKAAKKDALPAISAKYLARLAGLTPNHLTKLAAAGHIPKPVRGRFDADAAITALVKYHRDGREGSSEIAAAKLRHVDAQTEDVLVRAPPCVVARSLTWMRCVPLLTRR